MSSLTHKAGRLSLIFSVLGILVMILGVAAPAQALSYYQLQNGATGKCLDQNYSDPNNGAKVQMWNCWGGPNQQWAAQNCNYLQQCEIVNLWSGLCLDAQSQGITQNGDTVFVWTCWGGANQYWYVGFPDASNFHWQVLNRADGKCLDADANNPNDGAKVQLWDCWYPSPMDLLPAPNQTWSSPGASLI
jgi:Ricin-type beta-trefoil lectin domain